MSDIYPPAPRDPSQVSMLVDIYRSVAGRLPIWYLSIPLTTGAWPSNLPTGSGSAARLEANRQRAREIADALRENQRVTVIDPTAPTIAGWEQDDYRYFWGRVIEEFVSTVVFADGWESSHGCAYEFLVATRCGRDIRTEALESLSKEAGRDLISGARGSLDGSETEFLDHVLADLQAQHSREHA